MKILATASRAIVDGLLAILVPSFIGGLINWLGFPLFADSSSGVFFWILTVVIIFIAMPLCYTYFSIFYAYRMVFRRVYINNGALTMQLSKIIMKSVIKVVKKEKTLKKDKLELKKILNNYMEKWPWLIRNAVKAVLFFIPLWDMIKELDKNKMTEDHHEEISKELNLKMDDYIKEEILSSVPWFMLWLVPVNIGIMYLINLLA